MEFRDYDNASDNVKDHYRKQRSLQTLQYVKNMHIKNNLFTHKISIYDAFKLLDDFIDVSDPDINLPNLHHLLQTAEAIRKDGYPDWLQLVGLIHDLGKLLYIKGCDEDGTTVKEQWGIVGDTFVVGCKLPENIVYPEFNKLNPDMLDKKYNTDYGIYEPHCGLDNCYVAYGHDEYMYQVLMYNKCKLPDVALYIIRYHSLYPMHKYGEYQHLMNKKDRSFLRWVQLFNKYDLYSKEDLEVDIDKLMEYYKPIIEKYLGTHLYFY